MLINTHQITLEYNRRKVWILVCLYYPSFILGWNNTCEQHLQSDEDVWQHLSRCLTQRAQSCSILGWWNWNTIEPCILLEGNHIETRAGVCKTLCPQLPDSNTVWLQHCLAMTVITVQIYDFNVILSKGNNSKIGDDWDKKKIRITYFFMRNQNMKFQNISIHGSKLMLYTIKQRH